MRQQLERLVVETAGRGLFDCTRRVTAFVEASGVRDGLATLFLRHTSASLVIQENADPSVLSDLERFFARLVPEDPKQWRHNDEGPDDMPAHVRAALTQTHLAIPILEGRLQLGTWQGIYVYEHRSRPHRREVVVHLLGE